MESQHSFDEKAAQRNLAAREQSLRQANEDERLKILENCSVVLQKKFVDASIEVYLIGSITRPFQFRKDSDVDIVLKGFSGDRFEVWTTLEKAINRSVEIIIFETCHFQDHIVKYGLKVI